MKEYTLDIQSKSETGSAVNRRLRREGLIPAVLYHRGEESFPAVLSARQFLQLARACKSSQIFRTKSEDSKLHDRSLLVKEIQRDYQKDAVLHVDFQILSENEEIHVEIPLIFVGEAKGVKLDGGIMTTTAHSLEVSCLPRAIPENISIDVSGLAMGESIHAKDVPLPAGVTLHGNPELTLVSVVSVRVNEAVAEGAAAPAAGAAAAPAAGAAAAPAAADAAKAKK